MSLLSVPLVWIFNFVICVLFPAGRSVEPAGSWTNPPISPTSSVSYASTLHHIVRENFTPRVRQLWPNNLSAPPTNAALVRCGIQRENQLHVLLRQTQYRARQIPRIVLFMRLQLADVKIREKLVRGIVNGFVGDSILVREWLLIGQSVDVNVPALGSVVCIATRERRRGGLLAEVLGLLNR